MDIKEVVKEKYGQAALRVATGGSSCCGSAPATGGCDPITSNLYDGAETGQLPAEAVQAWVGCIAGARKDSDYIAKLAEAGFDAIDIERTRVYSVDDARQFLAGQALDVEAIAPLIEGKFISAFIRATKPADAEKSCCGPACCS